MISVICCSNKKELSVKLKANIAETIGTTEWEWLGNDNYKIGKGICQVYNESAAGANGDILCFVHEDVVFKTQNWGIVVERIFTGNANIGVVGIAGSTLVSRTPAGWYNFYLKNENRYNIVQHNEGEKCSPELISINPLNEQLSRALVVDGVLMFTKKIIWDEFRFDQVNFSEFHMYDLDFSLRVAQKYDNYVTFGILIEHFSTGKINRSWVDNVIIFERKYKGRLPYSVNKLTYEELESEESFKVRHLLNNMIRFKAKPLRQIAYSFRLMKDDLPSSLKFLFKTFRSLFVKI